MPLTIGGKRVVITEPEKQLQRLADLFVEAEVVGKELRTLEERVRAQNAWLDANPDHPRYIERMHTAFAVRQEQERVVMRLHDVAKAATRLVDQMDKDTRERAREEVHLWAELGQCGVYALAWGLTPKESDG
jgi:hypothetical protein